MRTFVLSLTVLLALTFTQPIYAEEAANTKIPKELQGSWIVDAEASIKNAKTNPKWKPEDEKKITMMMKMVSMICFTFHEDKVVSAKGTQKEQVDLELLSAKDGTYIINFADKNNPRVMTAILAKNGTLNLKLNFSNDMDYLIWKKGTLSAANAKTDIVQEIVKETLRNGNSKTSNNKIAVVSGQKIAFLGDSITAAGKNPGGYCRLVIDGLKKQGIDAKPIFAGISGHKSNQMLARLDKHVIDKKPDWMTLSCGVNDVWHGKNGVKLPDYKTNITAIVDKAQAQGIKVMILTSTMIKEDQSGSLNQQLLPYNAFLKKLSKEKGCLFADLNTDMQQALKKFPKNAPKGKQLTSDGVHMNAYGNIMMAKGLLKSFGVSGAKLATLDKGWKDAPGRHNIRLSISMSLNEYEQIQKKLDKPVRQFLIDTVNKAKEELLKK
ncbi:MAG: hypothetical protein FVQ82_10940 [Planctomycetes bacterium]|nr:hypothetical protein [Planctomycetota bacterium]